ncbi:hypothetical protein [Micromonospora sp. DT227]|uniref:hypothetical protein n=1 Tax=Micromonospora sp. DT227 TaxID=3393433 RepID=UPI003CE6F8D2
MTSTNSPQDRFAAFVRSAVDAATFENDCSIKDLVKGHIGRSTVFRWLAGDWQDYPELAKVRDFCTATGADYDQAMAALRGMAPQPPRSRPQPTTPEQPAVRQAPGRCGCHHCTAGKPRAPERLTVIDTNRIAMLTESVRRALPPKFHRPHWDGVRRKWKCRVCPRATWPCPVAQAHGDEVGISIT